MRAQPNSALVVDGGIVDLSARLASRWTSLREAIAAKALGELAAAAKGASADLRFDDVELDPVIPNPDKILCIGLNYASHVGEVGRQLPTVPSVFSRLHNTLVPHGGNIVRPRASIDFDFEGELAIVIGERCRHVLAGQRALGRGGLHLLPRRQRARLPEALGDGRQELPGDRAARTVDGDGRRDRRPAAARAHDAAERQRSCSTTRPIT